LFLHRKNKDALFLRLLTISPVLPIAQRFGPITAETLVICLAGILNLPAGQFEAWSATIAG
jgi:hypothetical protein